MNRRTEKPPGRIEDTVVPAGGVATYVEVVLERRHPIPLTAVIGGIGVIAFILIGLIGPHLLGDPNALHLDEAIQAPSAKHLFGTDTYGRDILTRTVDGTIKDLEMGVFGVVPPFIIGVILGAVSGYVGGWIDSAIMRMVDIVIAFPFFVLIIAIVAALGPGLRNMYIAIAVGGWVGYTRVMRSEVLVVKQLDYISAARVLGFSRRRVMLRHVLPNVIVQPLLLATSSVVGVILTGSALGFLGLGVQPPTAEWGAMIADGRLYLQGAPWMTIFPGLAIVIFCAALILLGDGLADWLRPELETGTSGT